MLHIGIDPGNTGAMALLYPTDIMIIVDFDDPLFFEILRSHDKTPMRCMIEKVAAMPKQGVASTFKFGVAYGMAQGMLRALRVPHEFVTPGKWQKEMLDSRGGGDTKTRALDQARRMRPELAGMLSRQKDHNRADAVLLALYSRRVGL